jgi:pyridoxal phosphate enzyme (YggS family)
VVASFSTLRRAILSVTSPARLRINSIADNLHAVRLRIERAAGLAGRSPSEIALLAVSKTFSAACVEAAHAAGQNAFGESYAQEAVTKVTALAALKLDWHFIGPVQSNKTRAIAEHFSWVHSIERPKVAVRLNDARPSHLPPLNVCIQINVSGEASKHGVVPGAERDLARAIAELPRLRLRGLMAIPEPTPDLASRTKHYARLRELQENLTAQGYALDTLSMGMSEDLEAAVAEGSTIVRVGTAIFGARGP